MIFDISTVNITSRYQHHFHNPQPNNHLHGSSHPVCSGPLSPTAVWFHSKEHKSHSFFLLPFYLRWILVVETFFGLLALVSVSGEHYFRTFEDFHHLTLAGCLTDQHHFANSLSSAAEPCHLPFDTNLKKKQSMRHLSYCRSKARFCSHFSESYFWSLTRWFSKLPTRQMYILKFSSLADTSP